MAKRREGAGPGGGEPGADRGGSPEPGPGGATPRGGARKGRGRTHRPYTPEDRRQLMESLAKSGMSVADFAATMGVAQDTLYRWKRRYEALGPKGLEGPGPGRPRGSGTGSRLPGPVQAAITETKARFPDFGLRRLRDYLGRFLHLRVSEGAVARVVRRMDLPPAAPPPRRKRRSEEPRRFERSLPGELWQSDITSYLLGRHHRRVYLTVFLDDHSRYVVAWNLQLHQRQELVTDCLLAGIERFGKPREVLTDQGRQYFAWRGKSDFQKLLIKEGIRHVVARAHHPETVGKCERLWKTVADELIDRAHPEDLEETRERLAHYFRHYNHFRPHQGLGGMTPADRLFGVEDRVRREVEAGKDDNALRLALGERPVSRSFLVGNFDGRQVAVRSGRDGLVIETVPVDAGGEDGDHGDGGEADARVPEAHTHRDAGEGGGGGAGPLGGGDGGGAEEGARDGGGDPEGVAREGDEGGGGGGAAGDGAQAVATQPDGGVGDGGGAAAAAAAPAGAGAVGGGGAEAPGGVAGEGARGDAGAGADPRADAGAPGGAGGSGEGCATGEPGGTRSDGGSETTGATSGEGEGRSPGATA
jgi:transposase InsO family protein